MRYHSVVIGGGFYGCVLAATLARSGNRVLLAERESELMTRASYVNQARLHMGYHYPRSFRTAASSRQNMDVFRRRFGNCVDSSFVMLYCIARSRSKVSRRHFERFSRTLGLPLRPAGIQHQRLFDARWIETVFEVEEFAFDASLVRRQLSAELAESGVEERRLTSATRVRPASGQTVSVELSDGEMVEEVESDWVFNCTYSLLNHIPGLSPDGAPRLKHQVAEVALVEVPESIRGLGITVMDGPFFSTMPFPPRGLHSLTHVRYTPHFSWDEKSQPEVDPHEYVRMCAQRTNFPRMVRDAERYMPITREFRHVESLFEIKTVLLHTEIDDARPIAFHPDSRMPRVISILGGKLDNVFDILAFMRHELGLELQ